MAVYLLRGREHVLLGHLTKPIFKCGQQALSVFAAGTVLAQLAGIAFDRLGTGLAAQLVVNAAGFLALVGIAYLVAWFKAPPWKQRAPVARPMAPPLAVPMGIVSAP
jgi:hypothetical protein